MTMENLIPHLSPLGDNERGEYPYQRNMKALIEDLKDACEDLGVDPDEKLECANGKCVEITQECLSSATKVVSLLRKTNNISLRRLDPIDRPIEDVMEATIGLKTYDVQYSYQYINTIVDDPALMGPQLEEWRDIEGFEGLYQVSNYGRVKRLESRVFGGKYYYTVKERIIKGKKHSSGYHTYCLSSNGKKKDMLAHRLLAIHFIPNPENKPCVNHKDGNKLNNSLNNIEWATYLENNQHAYDSKIKKPTWEGRSGYDHCRSKAVQQIDTKTQAIVNTFGSAMEAARKINGNNTSISSCCTGRQKTAYGYNWKYINE